MDPDIYRIPTAGRLVRRGLVVRSGERVRRLLLDQFLYLLRCQFMFWLTDDFGERQCDIQDGIIITRLL